MRFASADEIPFYFQPSKKSYTNERRYSYKVKEGIIRTDKYQVDLLVRKDNDVDGEQLLYWLKSYNPERKQVGHVDFAQGSDKGYSFGRIDCDTTVHMILSDQHRIFKISDSGEFNRIEN